MTDYKFDGKELRNRSGSKVAVFDGHCFRDAHGSKVGTIDGKYFRDSHGSKVAEYDGNYIRDAHGAKIGTMNDVEKVIDGVGGESLVAMWLFFVR